MKYYQKLYPPLEYQQMLQETEKCLIKKKKKKFDNSILILGASGVVLNAQSSYSISGWNNQRAEQQQTHRRLPKQSPASNSHPGSKHCTVAKDGYYLPPIIPSVSSSL